LFVFSFIQISPLYINMDDKPDQHCKKKKKKNYNWLEEAINSTNNIDDGDTV